MAYCVEDMSHLVADIAHLIADIPHLVEELFQMCIRDSRGIAPVYGDKYMKKGIRIGDLLQPQALKKRLEGILDRKNLTLQKVYGHDYAAGFNQSFFEPHNNPPFLLPVTYW